MTNMQLALSNLPQLFGSEKLIVWVPGLAFATILLLLLRRSNHFLITPGLVILATFLFYVYLSIAHISPAQASARILLDVVRVHQRDDQAEGLVSVVGIEEVNGALAVQLVVRCVLKRIGLRLCGPPIS